MWFRRNWMIVAIVALVLAAVATSVFFLRSPSSEKEKAGGGYASTAVQGDPLMTGGFHAGSGSSGLGGNAKAEEQGGGDDDKKVHDGPLGAFPGAVILLLWVIFGVTLVTRFGYDDWVIWGTVAAGLLISLAIKGMAWSEFPWVAGGLVLLIGGTIFWRGREWFLHHSRVAIGVAVVALGLAVAIFMGWLPVGWVPGATEWLAKFVIPTSPLFWFVQAVTIIAWTALARHEGAGEPPWLRQRPWLCWTAFAASAFLMVTLSRVM